MMAAAVMAAVAAATEGFPARLVRARASADARALASADWELRRKRDGRFLGRKTNCAR